MTVYVDLVMLLNFTVDLLLLLAANRLSGFPPGWKWVLPAAALGGVYGGICLLPGFRFLGNLLWRLVCLGIMSWIAFGWQLSAIRRGIVFVLLSMALGGIAMGLSGGGVVSLLLAALGIAVMCKVGFSVHIGTAKYIPVELTYGDRHIMLTALSDTGNTLRDPVTGCPVLVVGAQVAQTLLGLTPQQLRTPVDALSASGVPGLRLIPYRSIGQAGGMLLALRLKEVKIGSWKGSSLVAFAPEGLDSEGAYQALTGGVA